VGAAAAYGLGETLPLGLLAEALRAVALASLWARDRGAWMAWAANTSFAWTLTAIAHGGLVDVRFGADPLTTAPAVAVLAVAAAVGAVATRARR
jgi:hypothetical protein